MELSLTAAPTRNPKARARVAYLPAADTSDSFRDGTIGQSTPRKPADGANVIFRQGPGPGRVYASVRGRLHVLQIREAVVVPAVIPVVDLPSEWARPDKRLRDEPRHEVVPALSILGEDHVPVSGPGDVRGPRGDGRPAEATNGARVRDQIQPLVPNNVLPHGANVLCANIHVNGGR